jgi:hypothetical protein
MTRVDSTTNVSQCLAQESALTQNRETAQARFKRAAERYINNFLDRHHLSREKASRISFTLELAAQEGELSIRLYGYIDRDLLDSLGNELLGLAKRRGFCDDLNFSYSSLPSSEDEDEEMETEQPRVAQRRENPPEPDFELSLNDDATLEVQTPPPPPPDDEASHAPTSVTKEPRETNTVMNFPENYSEQQVTLPDGRVLIIHVAPGVEILNSDQESSDVMTFE